MYIRLLSSVKKKILAGALHGFAASPIAFIWHKRKRVVIQVLNEWWYILYHITNTYFRKMGERGIVT